MTPEVLIFIQTVGFPIALVIYLLARFEPRQTQSTRACSENTSKIVHALNAVRATLHEVRRAQLLYVQTSCPMLWSPDVKLIATRLLTEAEHDEKDAATDAERRTFDP